MKPRKQRREEARQRYTQRLMKEQPEAAVQSAELAALLSGQTNEGQDDDEA